MITFLIGRNKNNGLRQEMDYIPTYRTGQELYAHLSDRKGKGLSAHLLTCRPPQLPSRSRILSLRKTVKKIGARGNISLHQRG